MANDYFQFRQFTVHQDRCAMKVGTDGVLLGAWAKAPQNCQRVLDIGTGTGLIALMMAQRLPDAHVWAVDIDSEAVGQALLNVEQSPFASRITVEMADINLWNIGQSFDLIVCNPPFFSQSLVSPDRQRSLARHTIGLSLGQLAEHINRLMSDTGYCSLIIPTDQLPVMQQDIVLQNMFITRVCKVKTMPHKQAKRCLLEIRKQPENIVDFEEQMINLSLHQHSEWYSVLMNDFYLHL